MPPVILSKVEINRPEDVARKRLAPPFSLLYLAGALEQAGFDVILHHSQNDPAGIDELVRLVRQHHPLFVGLSVMTPHVIPAQDASLALRAVSDVPIVWGGIHPTIVPEHTARLPFVDVVCIGEGELTVVELARCFRDHAGDADRMAEIAGVAFARNGDVHVAQPRDFIHDLDSVRPAWHHLRREDYFYPGHYFHSGKGGSRVAVLNTGRGCPYRCAYCYNQAVHLRCVRLRSPQSVLEEVRELKEDYGVTGILFAEDNFFCERDRALQIARGIGVPWSASIAVADILRGGKELVDEVARLGCVELRIGVESGSRRILKLMHKPHTPEKALQVAEWIHDAGMLGAYMFMTGIPSETWEETLETLDLIDRFRAVSTNISIAGPTLYAPYPATELFDYSVKLGWKPPTTLAGWVMPKTSNRGSSIDQSLTRKLSWIVHAASMSCSIRCFSRTARWLRALSSARPALLPAAAASRRSSLVYSWSVMSVSM
jgi:anaerobic magnesium-protoporphyrin IX monomethyl ester cyclase